MATETQTPTETPATPPPAPPTPPPTPPGTPATPTAGTATKDFLGAPKDSTGATQSESKPNGQTSKDGEAPKPTGDAVPPAYDFKLPDGFKAEPEVLKEFASLAGEAKLPPEAAQKLLEFSAKVETQRIAEVAAQWTKQQGDWYAALENDKEIGGSAFEANRGLAKQVLEKFGSPDLTKFLAQTGLGNHPDFAKALVRLGKSLFSEGSSSGTRSATPTPANDEASFYAALYTHPSSPK